MVLRTATKKEGASLPIHQRGVAIARIAFGVAWTIAAWLKWQPAFISGFSDTVKGTMEGQPYVVQAWISLWVTIIGVNPAFFAIMDAVMETLLALCFLLGVFTNLACVIGIFLSLTIWSVGEGFGGPYIAGQSTDIGTAFPYAILCGLLLCVHAGRYYGLDRLLASRWHRLAFLMSGHEETKEVIEEKVPSSVGR